MTLQPGRCTVERAEIAVVEKFWQLFLDVERAITIAGVQPFIYESSAANSVFHSGSPMMSQIGSQTAAWVMT